MSSRSQLWNHFYATDTDDDVQRSTMECYKQELVSGEMFLDIPPESFWVAQGHEKDWVDHHAVMQRKSSMKLSSIGNSNHQSKSFSQRFSPSPNQKSKASLIGLPKTQKSCLVDGNFRVNKAGNARLFRSQSEPGGKLILEVPEPGSPTVSCTGRVETHKGRAKKTGFWSSFKSALRTGFGAKNVA